MGLRGTRDARRQENAIEALLVRAQERGLVLNRVSIVKLLYLADLRAVAGAVRPFSGFEWRWDNFGPFDRDFYGACTRLIQARVISHERPDAGEVEEHIYRPTAAARVADLEVDGMLFFIDAVLEDYGRYTAAQLRDITYTTPPMLAAQANGRGRGQVLELDEGLDDLSWVERADAAGPDRGFRPYETDLPRWREPPQAPRLEVPAPARSRA